MNPPVFQLLTADAAVSALVGARIYRAGHAPQGVATPYITWSVVGGHSENYLAQRPGIDQTRVQIDCWAKDAPQCRALVDAVVSALEMDGYMSGYPTDDFEQETQRYRYMTEFYFWTPR